MFSNFIYIFLTDYPVLAIKIPLEFMKIELFMSFFLFDL